MASKEEMQSGTDRPAPKTEPLSAGEKMQDKIVLITGGSTGIGKAALLLLASHGADISFIYHGDDKAAAETKRAVEALGRRCIAMAGDLAEEAFCNEAVNKTVRAFGRIDVLINNAGTQVMRDRLEDIKTEEMVRTFFTNVIAQFWITRAALPHMPQGSSIINTTSATAYQGHPQLLDYSATKGAIVSFTRSLALNLKPRNIRVNAVAPGPVYTPLVADGMDPEEIKQQDKKLPLQRSAQPNEIAPSYLFLACNADSAQVTGQVFHPNGGSVING